eukprot:6175376-Heterocapsa_arctica.AAC.1
MDARSQTTSSAVSQRYYVAAWVKPWEVLCPTSHGFKQHAESRTEEWASERQKRLPGQEQGPSFSNWKGWV